MNSKISQAFPTVYKLLVFISTLLYELNEFQYCYEEYKAVSTM